MSDVIKITADTSERTDKELQRAAPVALPAGSYDLETLTKALDGTAKASADKTRDEDREKIVNDLNETPLPTDSLGVPPGYSRVTVEDETVGVTEQRVVFDEKKIEEAEKAQENYQQPIDPAKQRASEAPSKGE